MSRVQHLFSLLAGTDDVHDAWRLIDAMAARGETGELVEAAVALERRGGELGATPSALESVTDRIERGLALTAGNDQVEALFLLASQPRAFTVQLPRAQPARQRQLAELIAAGQPVTDVMRAVEWHASEEPVAELCACLMQELVLRGSDLRHFAALRDSRHALSWLPLARSDYEMSLEDHLWQHRVSSSAMALPFGPSERKGEASAARGRGDAHDAVEENDAARLQRMAAAAFAPEGAEARLFRLTPRLDGDLDAPLLCRLGLRCLSGAAANDVFVERADAGRALTVLFCAAAYGGAYGGGSGGAHGRLRAWQSLGALADAPADGDFDAVERLAGAARFSYFDADSEWFQQVAWDFGLAALSADGTGLAILADTDTD